MEGKIIFIDIDGPLTYGTWADGKVKSREGYHDEFTIPYPWIKEDCDALYEIIRETNARLVVSSDWRKFFGIYQLKKIFEHYNIGTWEIIDTTSCYNPMRKMSSPPEWDRACEIKTWVKSYKPEKWIAIDDMPLATHFQRLNINKWRHVQVDGDFGIGGKLRDKIEECINKLNR